MPKLNQRIDQEARALISRGYNDTEAGKIIGITRQAVANVRRRMKAEAEAAVHDDGPELDITPKEKAPPDNPPKKKKTPPTPHNTRKMPPEPERDDDENNDAVIISMW